MKLPWRARSVTAWLATGVLLLGTACGTTPAARRAASSAPRSSALFQTLPTEPGEDPGYRSDQPYPQYRLTKPYLHDWNEHGPNGALSSFRFDPPPAALAPHLSLQEVLNASGPALDNASAVSRTILRFGLFTGTGSREVGPQHTLEPVAIQGVPGWLVIVTDVVISGSMGPPLPGFAVMAISDADGSELNGLELSGSSPGLPD